MCTKVAVKQIIIVDINFQLVIYYLNLTELEPHYGVELCYGDGVVIRKSSLNTISPILIVVLLCTGVSIYMLRDILFLLFRSRILSEAALDVSFGCWFLLMGFLIRICMCESCQGGDSWDSGGWIVMI